MTTDERALPPDGEQPERVKFDHVNTIVYNDTSAERIMVQVSVPLSDGSAADATVLLDSPVKKVTAEGRSVYTMNINNSFSVIELEKEPSGKGRIEHSDGLAWWAPIDYAGAWTAFLAHEPHVKRFLTDRFSGGAVFVDVGANVGAYSLRAAASGMRVYAFEPNVTNAGILKRNAELNKLSLELAECALGAEDGVARLTPNGAVSRITENGEMEVPVHTLDGYDLPAADLMKIDVEGYELEVLRGARKTLERHHPAIMVEMHHWAGAEKEAALFGILTTLGYRFEYLDRYAQGRHLGATWKA